MIKAYSSQPDETNESPQKIYCNPERAKTTQKIIRIMSHSNLGIKDLVKGYDQENFNYANMSPPKTVSKLHSARKLHSSLSVTPKNNDKIISMPNYNAYP